jgi:hypothetical protein
VENNVVYHVSTGAVMTQGPASGQSANTFNNNIMAYGRKAMFEEQNPWPQNCTYKLRANVEHNIFYFDLNSTTGFFPVNGCSDSCGMPYDQFQNFQGNLYWRTDGGFADDPNGFQILTTTPPQNQASSCIQMQNPQYTGLTFSQWQNGYPVVNGQPLPMKEDPGGTATVDPGFGDTGEPTDYLLSHSPVAGFNYIQTNNTINNAGRNNPVIMPPTVPDTYPTYYYSNTNY